MEKVCHNERPRPPCGFSNYGNDGNDANYSGKSYDKGQGHPVVVGIGSGATQLFQARPSHIILPLGILTKESKELAHRRWKDQIGYIQPRLMNLNYNNLIGLNNQNTKENRLKVSELMRRMQRKLLYFNLSEINVRLQHSGLVNLKKSYNNHFQPKQETKQRHEQHQGKLFFLFLY